MGSMVGDVVRLSKKKAARAALGDLVTSRGQLDRRYLAMPSAMPRAMASR
jgi:hypothetical protein